MEKENIVISTTTSTIQTKTVIEIWCVHLSEYLICAKKMYEMQENQDQNQKQNQNQKQIQNILFNGIQTMLHVFSILYYKINDVEEYYTQTQRAYLLYLEYLEHVYLKNKTGISPSLFVYNRIFEKTEESNNDNDCQLFMQIADWTNFILLRNILEISFLERHKLMEEFLQDYLLCFCQGNKKQTQEDTQIQIERQIEIKQHNTSRNINIDMWRQTFSEILQNNQ